MSAPSNRIRAVIFDIGGVVLSSPFIAIAQYERQKGLPKDYLNVSITARGDSGAWQQFERGKLPLFEFYKEFGANLSDVQNGNKWYRAYCMRKGKDVPANLPSQIHIDGRELFGSMMRQAQIYDPYILAAINQIRAAGKHRIIALTNNFSSLPGGQPIPTSELEYLGWTEGAVPTKLKYLFDDFCDSSELGMRKPELGIYLKACERNDVKPEEVVFLDDIRMNLKAAKSLGMQTIHVPLGGTRDAVKELEQYVGFQLLNARHEAKL